MSNVHRFTGKVAFVTGAATGIGRAELDEWDRILDINLRGTFVCMKHELAQMVRQGTGVIINTSSGAGIRGVAGGLPCRVQARHHRPNQVRRARLCQTEHPRERDPARQDTNAVIAVLRDPGGTVAQRLLRQSPGDVAPSAVVLHELYWGAYRSARVEHNLAQVDAPAFPVLDLDLADAREAGRLRRSAATTCSSPARRAPGG